MADTREIMMEEATRWRLRLDHAADEADWLAFTDWLEADPEHNAAYEAVMAEEDAWSPLLAEAAFPAVEAAEAEAPAPANDIAPRRRWGTIAASVCAAAIAGMLAIQLMPGSDPYAIQTAPGEIRTVTLADGGKAVLNGNTRLVMDRNDPRSVELASGEARFSIVHNAADPFTVQVGERQLVDVGTIFNVLHDGDALRVGVAEGSVRYDGVGDSVMLNPGDVLDVSGGEAVVSSRAADAIGSWADGSLVYEGTPLSEVAADLSRSTGIAISADPAIAARRFTGVIQTTGTNAVLQVRLGPLLGVRVEAREGSWTLRP